MAQENTPDSDTSRYEFDTFAEASEALRERTGHLINLPRYLAIDPESRKWYFESRRSQTGIWTFVEQGHYIKNPDTPRSHPVTDVEHRLGAWLSAALEDPESCAEFKEDVEAWFMERDAHRVERAEELGERITTVRIRDFTLSIYREERLRHYREAIEAHKRYIHRNATDASKARAFTERSRHLQVVKALNALFPFSDTAARDLWKQDGLTAPVDLPR